MDTQPVKPPYTFWDLLKDFFNWLLWFWLLNCLFEWSAAEGTQNTLKLFIAIWKLALDCLHQVAHVIKTA